MRAHRSLLHRLHGGGPSETRRQRYIAAAVIGCLAAWALSVGYLEFSPRSYTSDFLLVLPGTGATSSLDLTSLGQATTTSAAPFASAETSPTENYRKMLLGKQLLASAADKVGEDAVRFPTPKIELTDQTKLISVTLTGRTPAQAEARAEALQTAFQELLDNLRNDEIETRDTAYRSRLAGYKAVVDAARKRLIDYEAATGLVSADQYGTIVAAVERLRDIIRDVDAKLANQRAGVAELMRQLGVTADQANVAMLMRSDPVFQTLLDQIAKEEAEMATLTGTRGQNNPRVVDLQAERAVTAAKLTTRATELTGHRMDVLKLRDLSIHDERARLFERLIGQISDTEAMAAMHSELATQIVTEEARVARLASAAGQLDDLKRDVQVADAVFSSALARVDTNKSDFYSSYPLVQVLEQPELPSRPSSPLPILALAGGLAATLLIIASLVLTWLRTALLQRILKSA